MITKTLRVASSVACVATVLALTALPIWSQGMPDYVQTKTVSYADLDLNSSSGARTLYSRLMAAAYSTCDAAESADRNARTADDPCMRKSIGDAVTALNRPQLTEIYVAKYHSIPARGDLGNAVARIQEN